MNRAVTVSNKQRARPGWFTNSGVLHGFRPRHTTRGEAVSNRDTISSGAGSEDQKTGGVRNRSGNPKVFWSGATENIGQSE